MIPVDFFLLEGDSRSYLLTIRSDIAELRGSDVSWIKLPRSENTMLKKAAVFGDSGGF